MEQVALLPREVDDLGDLRERSSAADLHERAGEDLLQLRGWIGRAHERRADQDRVGTGELRGCALRARMDTALGYGHDRMSAQPRDELELPGPVDLEGREVASVDTDHVSVQLDRPFELVGVVRLDERLEAELARVREERRRALVVHIAQQ